MSTTCLLHSIYTTYKHLSWCGDGPSLITTALIKDKIIKKSSKLVGAYAPHSTVHTA
uniref:Uncharacterized protein n=1 Tax=Arundo donax TaxID=35708 RepID=A0A0A9EIW2_ARUDO